MINITLKWADMFIGTVCYPLPNKHSLQRLIVFRKTHFNIIFHFLQGLTSGIPLRFVWQNIFIVLLFLFWYIQPLTPDEVKLRISWLSCYGDYRYFVSPRSKYHLRILNQNTICSIPLAWETSVLVHAVNTRHLMLSGDDGVLRLPVHFVALKVKS